MMQVDRHELTGTVDELRRLFQAALATDRVAEKQTKKYGITAGVGCGMMFLGIFAAIFIVDSSATVPPSRRRARTHRTER